MKTNCTFSHIQLVPHLRRKYDRQFTAHFANPINEIIYEHLHIPICTLAQEIEFLAEEEWMFALLQSGLAKGIVAENAVTFEREKEGLQPILLHRKTREMLQRRRKNVNKLIEDRNDNHSTSDSQDTVVFLGEALQNFTFQNQESSETSSVYGSSFCDMYNVSEKSHYFLEFNIPTQQNHLQLKRIVEQTLRHLIVDFQSEDHQNPSKKRKKGGVSFGDSSTSYALDTVSSLGSEIQTVVRKQLKKYKIRQLFGRNSADSQRSSVRDKAELLLKNIRREILQ